MAKKRKAPTTNRHCRTCIHDREYPEEVVSPPYPVTYCGLVSNQPLDGPVFHEGEKPEAVRAWIRSGETEFNLMGAPIGRITVPCPGYENKESQMEVSPKPSQRLGK